MLLNFDLSGADWFVTAHYANEPRMIDVFRSGKSPHTLTAVKMFGIPEPLVLAESKLIGELSNPEEIANRRKAMPELSQYSFVPRSMSIRQMAKKANHGLNYCEGYRTFALHNEITDTEAKRIVTLYRESAYPGLLEWYERVKKTVRDTRTLSNCFGRTVYFQGALDDSTFRDAISFVPQSTTFEVTGHAMPLMLEDESKDFEPAELLAQVHDALLTQYLSRDYKAMARYAIKLGLDYMSPTLRYNDMDFTLSVGLKVGRNWGSLAELKLTPDFDALALELERVVS